MTSMVLVLALLFGSPAAQKKLDWMEGKLSNIERTSDVAPWPPAGGVSAPQLPVNRTIFTYILTVNAVEYQLIEQRDTPRYRVGDTIRFAVDKKTWFYLDAKGKQQRGGDVRMKK